MNTPPPSPAEFAVLALLLRRHVITEFVTDWIVKLEDLAPRVSKIRNMTRAGKVDEAKRHLPPERVYDVPPAIAAPLLLGG